MTLYVCATPIGHLKDITVRTLETLQSVDMIFCEDTRVSHKLLDHYDIQKPLFVYNDHTADKVMQKIIDELHENKNVALISDAGTPLISDPGYKLIEQCLAQNLPVIIEPGPSAVLTALLLSGLPPYPFCFGGFFDSKNFERLMTFEGTLIFFESPKRLIKTLTYFGKTCPTMDTVVMRELTKIHEERMRGAPQTLIQHYEKRPPKGEIVIACHMKNIEHDPQELLRLYLKHAPINEAVKKVSRLLGIPKKDLYKQALNLR